MKKQPRGSTDSVYDSHNNVSLVRWMDNAPVTITSNIHSVDPIVNVKRWSSKEKKTIQFQQSFQVNAYKKFMGGTNQIDENVNCYRVNIRTKKWWWRVHFLGCLVKLFRMLGCCTMQRREDKNMTLLHFRQPIVRVVIRETPSTSSAGRPRISVLNERYDNV